ncbi:MAG: glycosyltransferase [Caldilineales bacterium]|nr:glycosyltransferase [Caldilineales bacterium]
MLPLARAMAALGHELEVLIPAWDCPAEGGRVIHEDGVTLTYPRLGPAPHPLADPMLYRRMRQAVTAFQPEIVHVFKAIGYAGAVIRPLLKDAKVRVFVDMDDLESEAGWGARRNWQARRIAARQEIHAIRAARGVSAASVFLRIRVEGVRNRSHNTLYLPNGAIPATTPAPVATNDAIVLLYTRGNDLTAPRLERVWRRILADVPEAQLHVIGDWVAPDLPQSHHWGWLEPEEITARLREGAIALFPVEDDARTRAKSPARLLDCLAQGLPVATANVGEYGLLPGEGGMVIERGDDDALAQAAIRLLNDIPLRTNAGIAAWEQSKTHDWNLRAEELLSWYAAHT